MLPKGSKGDSEADWNTFLRWCDLKSPFHESPSGERGRVFDLARIREAAGLKQEDVAGIMRMKRSAVSRLEHSKVCTVQKAIRYAYACGFNLYVVAVKKGSSVVVV